MMRSFRQGPTGLNGTQNLGIGSGEKWMVCLPSREAGASPSRKLVLIAGATDGWSWTSSFDWGEQRKLCDQGYVVAAADFVNPQQWSNDAQLTALGTFITAMGADSVIQANTSKVSFIGYSRGATLALNWGWRHTSQLGAIVGQCPAVSLAGLHDRNTLPGTNTEIEAAYGGSSGYTAALPTHDPSHANNTVQIAVAAVKAKVRLYYSTDDPIVIPADVTTYQTATGVSFKPLGNVGHTPRSGNIHHAAQTAFIRSVVGA